MKRTVHVILIIMIVASAVAWKSHKDNKINVKLEVHEVLSDYAVLFKLTNYGPDILYSSHSINSPSGAIEYDETAGSWTTGHVPMCCIVPEDVKLEKGKAIIFLKFSNMTRTNWRYTLEVYKPTQASNWLDNFKKFFKIKNEGNQLKLVSEVIQRKGL
jgi:hypothetical protein